MPRIGRLTRILAIAFVFAGCYHATIDTGLTPGTTVINKPWASSFILGLVPPATVSTAAECRTGVARVETQHSFLNSLVHGLTFGIYTPVTIKVTCAAATRADAGSPSADLAVRSGAPAAVYQAVFASAAEAVMSTNGAVMVRITPSAPQR